MIALEGIALAVVIVFALAAGLCWCLLLIWPAKRGELPTNETAPPPHDSELAVPAAPVLTSSPAAVAFPAAQDLPYTRKYYLLTKAERAFFEVLKRSVPAGVYIFPQVRLANLLLVRKGQYGFKYHFGRIAAKCVDFVLCDVEQIKPCLVIELDDRSHDAADRRQRDAFVDAALRSAGLPVLHVRCRQYYDCQELAAQIAQALGLQLVSAPANTPVPLASNPPAQLQPALPAGTVAPRTATSHRPATCADCGGPLGPLARCCRSCGAPVEAQQR